MKPKPVSWKKSIHNPLANLTKKKRNKQEKNKQINAFVNKKEMGKG